MNCINFVVPMNPCGCGYYPDKNKCTCTTSYVRRHLEKISRPLLDRMDLTVEVPKVRMEELSKNGHNESSDQIRARVLRVHEIQRERLGTGAFCYNSRIPAGQLERYCPMEEGARNRLSWAYEEMDLSARAYHRLIRVARTVADLEESPVIRENHMMEALLFRTMDGQLWRNRP